MATTRTTSTLIRNAIEACKAAGMDVGAVEVLPGGAVRILPPEAIPAHRSPREGNSCDNLFEASDCEG
jgi:hypothetical protein